MNSWEVVMLASGSKGNAALLTSGNQRFLIDMGISCRTLVQRMRSVGVEPTSLSSIFLTHEHIDHIRGLATFSNKYQIPMYSSERTWKAILLKQGKIDRRWCRIMPQKLQIGNVSIHSFSIPHDATDPHGYCFLNEASNSKCTYLTDTGFVTDIVREEVKGSDILVLEANHDVEMLKNGDYPYDLKQRILSTHGHLSNDSAGWLLAEMDKLPEQVILAHLSEHNNKPRLALETISNILDGKNRLHETNIFVAKQDEVVSVSAIQKQIELFEQG